MAELGQAGNITTAGESGGGALLDFGSVRVRIPADAQLRLEAVDTQLVRVDTWAGRIDLCVLAAPRTSSLWSRMSREVAASQSSKGARVHTESGEWGEEVLSAKDGQLSRYLASDGPGWMLFGLAFGPEENSYELADTLRSMMRTCLVRRGNEPLPEKTPLPMSVPPGLRHPGDTSSSGRPEAHRPGAARPGADRSNGRQAGPVFQMGPTGASRGDADRARSAASGHGPAARRGSLSRRGPATRHGSAAPSGPSRDNRGPAAAGPAPAPEQRPSRWIRTGQVSLALGVVACLAVMVGWLLNGPGAAPVHYTPAMALPPTAADPAPSGDLALGSPPPAPRTSHAEGQPSQSAPELNPKRDQVAPPPHPVRQPAAQAPANAPAHTPAHAPAQAPGHTPAQAPAHAPAHTPAQSPAQAPDRAAHGPTHSGRSVTHAPDLSDRSASGNRGLAPSSPEHSADDAREDGHDHRSEDRSHSRSSSDESDRHDHRSGEDGDSGGDDADDDSRPTGPLRDVTHTLGGLGLSLGN